MKWDGRVGGVALGVATGFLVFAWMGVCFPSRAAFVVEARPSGRGFSNFVQGASYNVHSSKSAAPGCASTNSAFGYGTWKFRYTPGADADNFAPAAGLNLGNGNVATGLAGGASGYYNVYLTWPSSTTCTGSPDIVVESDLAALAGTNITWSAINQNDAAPFNARYPGANKWWCVATNVPLSAGSNYWVKALGGSTPVGVRFGGVMWELVSPMVSTNLSITASGGALFTLRWDAGMLQSASVLAGANTVWADVAGAVSPCSIAPSNAAAFYRLRGN